MALDRFEHVVHTRNMTTTTTVPTSGGVTVPAVPIVAAHIDISARPAEPVAYPATWTSEIIAAFESGRITYRRAERLAAKVVA
jgi:hypothetical protein